MTVSILPEPRGCAWLHKRKDGPLKKIESNVKAIQKDMEEQAALTADFASLTDQSLGLTTEEVSLTMRSR